MVKELADVGAGRKGEWMHVHSGGRFYPLDPRPEDIHIGDIANGLALDCRYAGQGKVDSFYSVAEHCVLLTQWALDSTELGGVTPQFYLALLLHDASEAYLNDLPRAVKHAVNGTYSRVEAAVEELIFRKFGVLTAARAYADKIKDLDYRIVQHEKDEIMENPQTWAFDEEFDELPGLQIHCWNPVKAKAEYLKTFNECCRLIG